MQHETWETCAWCGDEYPAGGAATAPYCSAACADEADEREDDRRHEEHINQLLEDGDPMNTRRYPAIENDGKDVP